MLSVALFALAPLTPLLSCLLKLINTLACNYNLLFTDMEQVQTSGLFNTEVLPTQYAVNISLYTNMYSNPICPDQSFVRCITR